LSLVAILLGGHGHMNVKLLILYCHSTMDRIYLFQVSAVIFTGLSICIFREDDSSRYQLLQAEVSACLRNNIPCRVVKAFLWRNGVSIILDGMLQSSHGLSSVNS